MARKQSRAEEIIGQLRTIEIEFGKGLPVIVACRKLSITEHAYDRWRRTTAGSTSMPTEAPRHI